MKVIIKRSTFAGGELLEADKKPVVVADDVGKILVAIKRAVLADGETQAEAKVNSKEPRG